MNPIEIIQKYYDPNSEAYHILVVHSKMVAKKAIEIAKKVPELNPDFKFIEEAAMVHDIGIFMTDKPRIDCHGTHSYIEHGVLGREIMDKEGYPRHGLVCETHVGVGITAQEIEERNLPLPKRDMIPKSVEEQIISLADNFYSKRPGHLEEEDSIEDIRAEAASYGPENLAKFEASLKKFKML